MPKKQTVNKKQASKLSNNKLNNKVVSDVNTKVTFPSRRKKSIRRKMRR